MNLTDFEKQVLRLMLQDKLGLDGVQNLIDAAHITGYDYTGAGYFLELRSNDLNLSKETIHSPLIRGSCKDLNVGFVLFVDNDKIIIECHSWGIANPPDIIRELELYVSIEK